MGIVDLPGLDQFLRRARDAKRARDVVGGAEREQGHGHGTVGQPGQDLGDGAVAAGDDQEVGLFFKRLLKTVTLDRDVTDVEVRQLHRGQDIVLGRFMSGRGIVE